MTNLPDIIKSNFYDACFFFLGGGGGGGYFKM